MLLGNDLAYGFCVVLYSSLSGFRLAQEQDPLDSGRRAAAATTRVERLNSSVGIMVRVGWV